jgi:hypothetical protein
MGMEKPIHTLRISFPLLGELVKESMSQNLHMVPLCLDLGISHIRSYAPE